MFKSITLTSVGIDKLMEPMSLECRIIVGAICIGVVIALTIISDWSEKKHKDDTKEEKKD